MNNIPDKLPKEAVPVPEIEKVAKSKVVLAANCKAPAKLVMLEPANVVLPVIFKVVPAAKDNVPLLVIVLAPPDLITTEDPVKDKLEVAVVVKSPLIVKSLEELTAAPEAVATLKNTSEFAFEIVFATELLKVIVPTEAFKLPVVTFIFP